uniref:putative solute carrier family 22 member 31 n=1 Tax=Myxine glutinosa TaxID=7769 RepID=UPI00358F4DC6
MADLNNPTPVASLFPVIDNVGISYDLLLQPAMGPPGRSLRYLLGLAFLPFFFLGCLFASNAFMVALPADHRCTPAQLPRVLRNATQEQVWAALLAREDELGVGAEDVALARCRPFNYWPANMSAVNNSQIIDNLRVENRSCKAWVYSQLHTGLRGSVVTEWNLVCGEAWYVQVQHLSFFLGFAAGAIAFGTLMDRCGRRSILLVMLLLSCLLGLFLSLSVSITMFTILRLLEGLCLPPVYISLYLYQVELRTPQGRMMAAMFTMLMILAGKFFLPVLAYVATDWHVLRAILNLPLALTLSLAWKLPEVPRWLLATRQLAAARSAVEAMAVKNGATSPEFCTQRNEVFHEIEASLEFLACPRFFGFADLLASRNIGKNAAVLCLIAFLSSGLLVDLSEVLSQGLPAFHASYLSAVGVGTVGCLLMCLFVDHIGRRPFLLCMLVVVGLASLLLLALPHGAVAVLSVPLSLLGILGTHATGGLVAFIAAEVSPTALRAAVLGLVLASACLGKATSPFLQLLPQQGTFLQRLIFAALSLVGLLSVMFLPESRLRPLPDSLADAEAFRSLPAVANPFGLPSFHAWGRFGRRCLRDKVPLLKRGSCEATMYSGQAEQGWTEGGTTQVRSQSVEPSVLPFPPSQHYCGI